MDSSQNSDSAHVFGDRSQSENLSEIKPSLTEVLFKFYCARKSARKCGNQFSSWNAAIHMLSSARFDSENCCKGTKGGRRTILHCIVSGSEWVIDCC